MPEVKAALRAAAVVYLLVMCSPCWAMPWCLPIMDSLGSSANPLERFIVDDGSGFDFFDGQTLPVNCVNCATLGQTVAVLKTPPPLIQKIIALSRSRKFLNKGMGRRAGKVLAARKYFGSPRPLYLADEVPPRIRKKVMAHNWRFSQKVGRARQVEVGAWEVVFQDGSRRFGVMSDYGEHSVNWDVLFKALLGVVGPASGQAVNEIHFYHVHPEVASLSLKDQMAMFSMERSWKNLFKTTVKVKWTAVHLLAIPVSGDVNGTSAPSSVVTTTISTDENIPESGGPIIPPSL